jgi:FAD/FMN-containing dehydrogenase
MTEFHIAQLEAHLGRSDALIREPQTVERLSKDFYWYSPILKPLLDNKRADVIVQPRSVEEISVILGYCFAENIPVTVRGSGTGNYGQAVPLEGGVVLDLTALDQILAIEPDGVAVCEPGARLGTIEAAARKVGWELRCYPSTYVKASVGGFLAGGSGGIGSITYGALRDNQTVRAIEVLTMEKEPRLLRFLGDEVQQILHSWGTNGIITKIWLALGPRRDWAQVAIAFPSFTEAYDYGERLSQTDEIRKRLVTIFEWPIPSYFLPMRKICPEEKALIFCQIDDPQLPATVAQAEESGGQITFAQPYQEPRRGPLLTDYTWNHTTLWAIKVDPALTYLQCNFDPDRVREQFRLLRARFGNDFLFHMEMVKNESGRVIPCGLPIVRYRTEPYLNEMIDYCRQIGVSVANPHVNQVEGGGRFRSDNRQLQAKYQFDPNGLLNPGKMATFRKEEPAARQRSSTEVFLHNRE